MELSYHQSVEPPARWLEPSHHEGDTRPPAGPEPTVGARISTLRGLRYRHGASGLGRIAAFGVATGARRWSEPVLVSNAHVLNAHGTEVGDTVFQPELSIDDHAVRFDARRVNPVAALQDAGHDGPYRYAYPGEQARDYFIDCASARLTCTPALPCGHTAFSVVARAHPLDVLPNRRMTVKLAGVHQHPAGRITDVTASVEDADGRICPNCIVIETLPGHLPFAADGDSGALLTDDLGRAVGLLWAVDLTKPGIAYACHIHPVLDRLGLTLSQRMSIAPHGKGDT